jgi:hypothetical protein
MASPDSSGASAEEASSGALRRRHLRFGWWALLFFLSLGMALEGLHAFKVDWYLNVAHQTRRLMLTLGHSHGTLLALVNIAFALSLHRLAPGRALRLGSACLLGAALLLPGGFLLGGLVVYGGDPGAGILLVPVGGLLLLLGVLAAALRVR